MLFWAITSISFKRKSWLLNWTILNSLHIYVFPGIFYAKYIWNRSSGIGDRVDKVKKKTDNGQKRSVKSTILNHKRNEIFVVQTVYIVFYSLTWCIGWYSHKAYTLASHTKCITLSFQGRIRNNWLAVKNYTNMMFINSVYFQIPQQVIPKN